jgi:hypothetical protein
MFSFHTVYSLGETAPFHSIIVYNKNYIFSRAVLIKQKIKYGIRKTQKD